MFNYYDKVSDLQKNMGLSANGFRLYEKAGIFKASRNPENNYRVVHLGDACALNNAIAYNRFGLSLKETEEVQNHKSLKEQMEVQDRLLLDLSQRMTDLILLQRQLMSNQKLLQQYLQEPDLCGVVPAPKLWFLPVHAVDMETPEPGAADCAAWQRRLPMIKSAYSVALDDLDKKHLLFGPAASEETALQLRLPLSHAKRFVSPSNQAVRMFALYPAADVLPESFQKRLSDYLRQENLKSAGPIWGQMFNAVKQDGELYRLDELLLPVEQNT